MFALLLPLLFIGIHCSDEFPGSSSPVVTYDELQSLNARCDNRDTCQREPPDDDLRRVNCHCGPQCIRLGTCCLDAPQSGPISPFGGGLGCTAVYGNDHNIFMVDKCSIDWDGDDLCTADGEEKSDVTLLVPVTSLRTGITYRNYFCFMCNSFDDSEDSLMSWDIKYFNTTFYSHLSNASDIDPFTLSMNKSDRFASNEWTHPQAPNKIFKLQMSMSDEILKNLTTPYDSTICRRYFDVVDSCAANWTEPLTRSKCESYTALVTMGKGSPSYGVYRNVHCGVCNWADVRNTEGRCWIYKPKIHAVFSTSRAESVFKTLFKIAELSSECPEGYRYFKFVNGCRKFRCGLKGKGKC